MNVRFYTINKKHNSTKLPTDEGTLVDCKLKDSCSIILPMLTLNLGATTAPSYNYCYIEDFSRYYFVNNWTYNQGLWSCTLSIDVLATYKNAIGNATQFVLRSSSLSNGSIIDTMYPITTNNSQDYNLCDTNIPLYYSGNGGIGTATSTNFFNKTFNNGYVTVVVANDNGGPQIYQMIGSVFSSFYNKVLQAFPSDMGSIADGIKKSLYKPIQYIQLAYWTPVPFPDVDTTALSTLRVGTLNISGMSCSNALNYNSYATYTFSFNLDEHPQASVRGSYLNTSNYTDVNLLLYPFGNISLPVDKLIGYSKVNAKVIMDIKTGQAELEVYASKGSGTSTSISSTLYHSTGMWGMSIPIVQSTVDVLGAVTNAVSGGMMLAGASSLGKLGKEGNASLRPYGTELELSASSLSAYGERVGMSGAEAISSALGSVAKGADVTTSGVQGSSIQFTKLPQLQFKWFYITDENKAHKGRPLCMMEKLSDIPGFIICDDGDIDLTATQEEKNIVSSFLTGGFFYE